jgi:hypothetical protein
MRNTLRALMAALLAVPFPVCAGIVEDGEAASFRDAVAGVPVAARNLTVKAEEVKDLGDRVFGRPGNVRIKVDPQLRGWDFLDKAPNSEMNIPNLIEDARARMSRKGLLTSNKLFDAIGAAELLHSMGRFNFSEKGQMSPGEGGVFYYDENSSDPGRAFLNGLFLEMEKTAYKETNEERREALRAAIWIAAESFLIHEAAHAAAHAHKQLHPTKVIDGEVVAFGASREFARAMDPHGEGVATSILVAQQHEREFPSQAAKAQTAMLNQLGDLWRTDGTREKIEKNVVIPAGYTEKKGVL